MKKCVYITVHYVHNDMNLKTVKTTFTRVLPTLRCKKNYHSGSKILFIEIKLNQLKPILHMPLWLSLYSVTASSPTQNVRFIIAVSELVRIFSHHISNVRWSTLCRGTI